jgi:hypothetical protein
MSITYATATANARLAAEFTAAVSGQSVDGGSSYGQLVIGTSALAGAVGVLATITLQKPSVSIASKVATVSGVPLSTTASAAGTAALAELHDSAGNVIVSGITVGTAGSGANVIIGTVSGALVLSIGETVTLASATFTHP